MTAEYFPQISRRTADFFSSIKVPGVAQARRRVGVILPFNSVKFARGRRTIM
jgi:hypothetical protein